MLTQAATFQSETLNAEGLGKSTNRDFVLVAPLWEQVAGHGPNLAESNQLLLLPRETNACKISSETTTSFQLFILSVPASMCSSLTRLGNRMPAHLLLPPTLLLAEMMGTGGLSAPQKSRVQQQYLVQANVSLGWQLHYMFLHSRYLVSFIS